MVILRALPLLNIEIPVGTPPYQEFVCGQDHDHEVTRFIQAVKDEELRIVVRARMSSTVVLLLYIDGSYVGQICANGPEIVRRGMSCDRGVRRLYFREVRIDPDAPHRQVGEILITAHSCYGDMEEDFANRRLVDAVTPAYAIERHVSLCVRPHHFVVFERLHTSSCFGPVVGKYRFLYRTEDELRRLGVHLAEDEAFPDEIGGNEH